MTVRLKQLCKTGPFLRYIFYMLRRNMMLWLLMDLAEWKLKKALLYTRHIRAYTKMVLD